MSKYALNEQQRAAYEENVANYREQVLVAFQDGTGTNITFAKKTDPAHGTLSAIGTNGIGDSPRQRLANAVVENFADPRLYTDAFFTKPAARALVKGARSRRRG